MKLTDLRPAKGAVKNRKRVGRGEGSGSGGTAGRGHKGHKSRSGGGQAVAFEGGQMPIIRRLPKGGFRNINRVEYQVVNVGDLNRCAPDTDVTLDLLRELRLARKRTQPVKLLGHGAIDRPVKVRVHAVSATARQKIEAAGGTVELLETQA